MRKISRQGAVCPLTRLELPNRKTPEDIFEKKKRGDRR